MLFSPRQRFSSDMLRYAANNQFQCPYADGAPIFSHLDMEMRNAMLAAINSNFPAGRVHHCDHLHLLVHNVHQRKRPFKPRHRPDI